MTSGFKALSAEMTYNGTDELRQACGGAGYLMTSGMPTGFTDIAPAVTYDGVTPVLMQQSARFILKAMGLINKGKKLPKVFHYLNHVKELGAKKFEGAWTIDKISEAL